MITNPNDGNTPRVEIATPAISVSSDGLITATSEQAAGYVPGGTNSSTKQLSTQEAATITPGTAAQTAVPAGRYTTGAVRVEGDANLVAENIAEGVSIFGVAGTHSGGGATVSGAISCIGRAHVNVLAYTGPDGPVWYVGSLNNNGLEILKDTAVYINTGYNVEVADNLVEVSRPTGLNSSYHLYTATGDFNIFVS